MQPDPEALEKVFSLFSRIAQPELKLVNNCGNVNSSLNLVYEIITNNY